MELSDFEYELMQLFWKSGELAAPDAHQMLKDQHPTSYSTVKTIIDRLEKKGAIQRTDQKGRTIFYGPKVTEKELRKPLIRAFINKVFPTTKNALFSHLIEEEELSLEEINYLEKLVEAKKKELKK